MKTNGQSTARAAGFQILAAVVALIGICDTAYLTYHHYMAEPVPCSIVSGCEQVLTSQWATLGGFLPVDVPALAAIPLAGLGLAAYLVAFLLAAVSIKGNRKLRRLFGIHVSMMAVFSGVLLYLQGFVIESFCQYCLLSALTSATLFVIAVVSRFWRPQ